MPKAIVIYRLGSIGDTVIALPCFHAIARAFPEYRRIALSNVPVSSATSSLFDVLGPSGLVHDEVAYPVGSRSPKTLLRLRREIMATGADQLIYLMPERSAFARARDLLFLRACGLRHIVGASPEALSLRVVNAQTGEVERECARLARSIAALGAIDLAARGNWDLMLTSDERARARSVAPNGPFLAVNMGGKVAINDWGADNWAALLQSVSEAHPNLALVILGGVADRERADLASRNWTGRICNLCGALTVREAAAVLERAGLFVGHDSGPMHLAAAVGAPFVALFGDNNPPKKWHPISARGVCLHEIEGVRRIRLSQVLAPIEEFLAHGIFRGP